MALMAPGSAAAGPASIQQLAQNAAQAVLRRQRMKALIHQGAQNAAGGSAMGGAMPMRGHFMSKPTGSQGSFRLPYQTLQSLQQAANQYGNGGMFGAGGGGADFGSLPDLTDEHQSPASLQPPQAQAPPSPQAVSNMIPRGETPAAPATDIPGIPGATNTLGPNGAGGGPQGPVLPSAGLDTSGSGSNIHGWIPLGGGLFYDPTNDIVRGSSSAAPANGLNPIDRRF